MPALQQAQTKKAAAHDDLRKACCMVSCLYLALRPCFQRSVQSQTFLAGCLVTVAQHGKGSLQRFNTLRAVPLQMGVTLQA